MCCSHGFTPKFGVSKKRDAAMQGRAFPESHPSQRFAGQPRPWTYLVAAGLLTCGSSPFSSLPGTCVPVALTPPGVEAARRLQLRGQFRPWTLKVRTGFPLSCDP
ncbi:beta-phosphoglucomutase-like phosphatase (HAD superfamily) [Rhizobium borbori]|uniref:Beta-phosphoglucomutase-like phosphatase (HAD superfamily) n=1 Tax=Allorhizobium borbori TaxID=485907 RepID=A0A7W6K2V1_9HYPH|nr:beta-phosphoglucomutase-like phosphatase (HAD superfamily) [Allorhizobium borbori]